MKVNDTLEGYLLALLTPDLSSYVYIAKNANIKNILYSDHPTLLGTKDTNLAKIYKDIEEAKNDLYLLRYYHRQFINIRAFIIPVYTSMFKSNGIESLLPCNNLLLENPLYN